jgi:hypothetical protein
MLFASFDFSNRYVPGSFFGECEAFVRLRRGEKRNYGPSILHPLAPSGRNAASAGIFANTDR